MEQHFVNEKALRYQEFLDREEEKRHHTSEEDLYQYDLIRAGDPRAAEEHVRILFSELPGKVSEDPIRNMKYLTVASATLASRAALDAGVSPERAYTISDLYLQKMDLLETMEELRALNYDMFAFYAKEVAALDKKTVYSKHVVLCMDYIYEHLNEPIRIRHLAELVGLSENYLSVLFKKQTGYSVSDYILSKRMEAAQNMLKFSSAGYAEIAAILTFSSQSHFTRAFKQYTGYTPKTYRDHFFRR